MTTPFPPTGAPEPSARAPRARRGWVVGLAVLLVAAVAVVVALVRDTDGSAPATVPPATATTTTTATTEPEPTGSTSQPAAGCAPTEATAPAGADIAPVVDVDGDGRPDMAWLSGGASRAFGITTASGATFSTPIESASPIAASAVVNRVQSDGIPIALVDLGREAIVYSVAACAVTPVQNAEGQPYRFDRGFAGAGTGVGCTGVDGALRLAGLDAVADAAGTFTVTRTFVDVSADARAVNGAPERVATGAAPDDPVVTTAQEVSCGDLVAGTDGPVEPQ